MVIFQLQKNIKNWFQRYLINFNLSKRRNCCVSCGSIQYVFFNSGRRNFLRFKKGEPMHCKPATYCSNRTSLTSAIWKHNGGHLRYLPEGADALKTLCRTYL